MPRLTNRHLFGALAEAARQAEGYPVALRQKSMHALEAMGWVVRVKTGEISPGGVKREIWRVTPAGHDALKKYLAE